MPNPEKIPSGGGEPRNLLLRSIPLCSYDWETIIM